MNLLWGSTLDLVLLWFWAQFCILALAALGAPLTASLGQLTPSPFKAFAHKLAKQLAGFSVGLVLTLVVCSVAVTLYALKYYPEFLPEPAKPFALLSLSILGLAALLILLYRFLWGPLKKLRTLQGLLGLKAGLAGLLCIFVALGLKRALLFNPELLSGLSFVQGLKLIYLQPATSNFWPFLAQLFLMSVTASAALGLILLLARRKRDDFGRDYYNYALKHCARYAWVSALLQLPILAWLAWRIVPSFGPLVRGNPAMWAFGAAGLSLFLAAFLWNAISRSDTPLREKPVILLAILLPGTGLWALALPFVLQFMAMAAR